MTAINSATSLTSSDDVGSSNTRTSAFTSMARPIAINCGTAEGDFGPLDGDCSRINRVDAGQRLDQGRLSGPVLAHQRMDLAREKAKRNVLQRFDAGERDIDVRHLDDGPEFGGRHFARHSCSSQVHFWWPEE